MAKEDFEDRLNELYGDIEDLQELAEYHLDDLREWDRGTLKFQRAAELVQYNGALKQMVKDLEKMETIFTTIRDDLAGSEGGSDVDSSSRLRTITVVVSEGMIRNSMLTLSSAIRAGIAKVGEHFTIRTPQGPSFETVIMRPGNRFQERRRIRQFYEDEGVSAGDELVLSEKEPGVWLLGKPLNRRSSNT